MDLQEFVKVSITQIVKGVIEAQTDLSDTSALINPHMRVTGHEHSIGVAAGHDGKPVTNVEFDVAVSASEESGIKGGIGVVVAAIGIGSQARTDISSGTSSRISFKVPILLPTHQK